MKKLFIFIFVFLGLFGISSCDDANEEYSHEYQEITYEIWDEIKNTNYQNFTYKESIISKGYIISLLNNQDVLQGESEELQSEILNNKDLELNYVKHYFVDGINIYESTENKYLNTSYDNVYTSQTYIYGIENGNYQGYVKPHMVWEIDENDSFVFVEKDDWGHAVFPLSLHDEVSSLLCLEFDDYTYNPKYGYYEITNFEWDLNFTCDDTNHYRNSYKLYFQNNKLVKAERHKEISKEYLDILRLGNSDTSELSKNPTSFVNYEYILYEISNYETTIAEKPSDLIIE